MRSKTLLLVNKRNCGAPNKLRVHRGVAQGTNGPDGRSENGLPERGADVAKRALPTLRPKMVENTPDVT
eukprot:2712063-Lingulodinium_polyedra.AAC.1